MLEQIKVEPGINHPSSIKGDQEAKIRRLAQAMMRARGQADNKHNLWGRTIVVVGAGCSVSAGVKDARRIAQHCVTRLSDCYGKPSAHPGEALAFLIESGRVASDLVKTSAAEAAQFADTDPRWWDIYDLVFRDHYCSQDEVRELFGEIIAAAEGRINWAHLCLGELVRERYVSTVITTNFDQLALAGLARAGILPVSCDGIESLNRLSERPHHPQLVEIHGSRHTYMLRNRPEDVEALATDDGTVGAVGKLFAASHVVLVVGYGGREKGVMTVMLRAAERNRDKHVAWTTVGTGPNSLTEQATRFLKTSRNALHIDGQDADSFFAILSRELGLGAPRAVREPLDHLRLQAALVAPPEISRDVKEQLARSDREMKALAECLERYREQRTVVACALDDAREHRLKGEFAEAYQLLQAVATSPEAVGEVKFWRAMGDAADLLSEQQVGTALLREAETAWKKAVALTSEAEDPELWVRLHDRWGSTLRALGERLPGPDGEAKLEEAIQTYDVALKPSLVQGREAKALLTQMNRAIALQTLGDRLLASDSDAPGYADMRDRAEAKLREAVTAHDAVLHALTQEAAPAEWAMTQMNRGIALASLGRILPSDEARQSLAEAIAAYDSALVVRSRAVMPLDWAVTQINRADALTSLARHLQGSEREAKLKDALAGCDLLLDVVTRLKAPLYWAIAQANRGDVLVELGDHVGGDAGAEMIKDGISGYDLARQVTAGGDEPLDGRIAASRAKAELKLKNLKGRSGRPQPS